MIDDALARRLFDATPDAMWLLGYDGQTIMANQRFADLVGYPLADIGSVSGYTVSDEQGRADFERHLESMRSGHPGTTNEDVLLVRSDGTRIWALVSWVQVPDETGTSTIGCLHRLTEHTERRRLIDELRTREDQLATAQRIARIGSWTWDIASDVVLWSPELYDVYGVDDTAVPPTYAGFVEQVHPEDRAAFRETVLGAIHQQDRYVFEGRTLTSTGDVRWIRNVGEVERDSEGSVVGLSGTGQDVTERRQALEAATTATRRLLLLQQLAEAANRSTTLADALVRSAELLDSSTEWTPLCVLARTARGGPLTVLQLPHAAVGDLPHPDLAAAEECWSTRETVLTPQSDAPGRTLMSLPVQSGRSMACVVQVIAELDNPDNYTFTLMTQVCDQLSSVAERERAADLLSEARDQAMAASQHKSEFLATMSHEIRTPLNGVIGLTDLLLRTELDDRQHRLADGLRGAGLTLLALITDVLDLSKIESGKLELEAIEFDIRHVVDETAMILAGPAADKGLELVVGCAPEVPRLVRGDPVRLGQVLTNLGSNAVKFTETGEVVIDIQLDVDAATADGTVAVLVEVRDTGIGISEASAAGLFDAFTQADRSTTRQHGGTGLGLAICRQLVEGMGGTIGVRSVPGAGSVFWFTATFGTRDSETTHHDQPLRRRRVLVAVDHLAVGSFLVRQLLAWQLEVDQAATAEEAAAALAEAAAAGSPYDVVLVDLAPAGLGSLELARAIRHDAAISSVDLVLVAADGSTSDSELRAAGFRLRIAKPVRTSELHAALVDGTAGQARDVVERVPPITRPDLGLRVLVVEDNAVNQLVATGLLENLGCTVETVNNGEEAVEALPDGHGFDVVLMDCRMPRMDGFDATRAIRAREQAGRRVPIIAMTASALPGERDRCLDAGMDDFLTKPVDPVQLNAAIARAGSPRPAARTGRQPGPESGSESGPGSSPGSGVVEHSLDAGPAGALDLDRVSLLSELVKDGISFFERTRMSFLSRIDGALARISIAVSDGDAGRAAADAHQLRGSALNLGLVRVGAVAGSIEELARTGDLTGGDELVATLREAVTDGVVALAAVNRP